MNKEYYDIVFFPDALVRGGAERVTVLLSEYFTKNKLKVAIIITGDYTQNDYPVPEGVELISIGGKSKSIFELIIGYYNVLKEIDYKIGVLMGLPHGCYIIPASKMAKKRIIASERNSPKNFNGRFVTKHLMRFMMKYADGYIFQTNEAMAFYKNTINKPSEVILNPVDSSSIPHISENSDVLRVISVGRLAEQKNQKMMIKSFKDIVRNHSEATLTIYGEGELRHDLEELIVELGLQNNIKLPGIVSDVLQKEAESGMFIFSSDFEGIPNALVEAMAVGLPCVSTDCPCGGPASIIDDKVNGQLIPVGDQEALTNAIEWYISDPTRAKEIGKRAAEIRNKLSIGVIGQKWIRFLEKYL